MTTKPSLYWVEPSEIALLVQRVSEGGSVASVARTGVTRTAVTQAPIVPATKVPSPGPPISEAQAPIPQAVATMPAAPSPLTEATDMPFFTPTQGALEVRLTALLSWLGQGIDFDHAFVVDQDGLALVHESSAPLELIAASAEVSSTWNSLRQRFGLAERCVVKTELRDGRRLYLLTVITEWGELSLGWVVVKLVGRSKIDTIYQRFQNLLVEN